LRFCLSDQVALASASQGASTVDLLKTFAAQSVLAIQNARLFSEIGEKSQHSRAERWSLRAAGQAACLGQGVRGRAPPTAAVLGQIH
jgi:GAF domain-containing protein